MPDRISDFPDTPHAVESIRRRIRGAFDTLDEKRRKVGNAKHGVYLFTTTTESRSTLARRTKVSGSASAGISRIRGLMPWR